jgi:hypothetical protein
MTTGRLITQDEKLYRATIRVLADVIIGQSASDADIISGIYKPINKTASLLNLERLFDEPQEAVVTIKSNLPSPRNIKR